jgi:hypothetical protein
MQVPAEPDLQRYYTNHRVLAARLLWLWNKVVDNAGAKTHHRADLENFVLQTRLACEQYALLMQSACFQSLPGSPKKKSKKFDAVLVLREVRRHLPHVKMVPLSEIEIGSDNPQVTFRLAYGWEVNNPLFERVYELGGNFLHTKNQDFDLPGLQIYLNNAISLINQLILVTWRHAVMLDGLAEQVVSQILPDGKHLGFVLKATGENIGQLRAAFTDAAS